LYRYEDSEVEGEGDAGATDEEDEEDEDDDAEDEGDAAEGMRYYTYHPCLQLYALTGVTQSSPAHNFPPHSMHLLLFPDSAPPVKKRKTGPVSADAVPADEDEVEDEEEDGAGVPEDDVGSEEEDVADEAAPAAAAAKAKGGVVPAEDDLDEVNEATAADEEDED
jgi:hypothetical protein